MSNVKIRIATAILFATSCATAVAAEAPSEGTSVPEPHNYAFYSAPGPDEDVRAAVAPLGTSPYLFVAGSAFTARSSSQTVSYPGSGCTSGDGAVTTDVQLPDGTTVFGVRMYYYDMATAGSVAIFLTNYTGLGDTSDLVAGPSTLETGYSSEYFELPTSAIIDNASGSYVLTATMAPGLRFCGARLFFTLP